MQFIRKNLKPILLIIVIAFVVSIFYGLGQYRSSGNRPQNVGNMIAEVNGEGISYQQWQNAFLSFISRYDNQTLSSISDETLAFIKNNITEQLINTTLLYQYAQDQKLNVSANELNDEIEQIKNSFNSEVEFNEALKRSNLTLNQLKNSLTEQLMINKAITREYEKINITEDEIARYYKENKAYFYQPEKRKISHILVENREDAELFLKQLKDGLVQFDKLAQDKSICPSAEKGGDLGYITRGQMVSEFEEAAFSLEIGEISAIVETEYGYHIIKCDDIQKEKQLSLEEAKDDIKTILTNQKQNEAIEALLTQLREGADIKIHYDFTSELAAKEEVENQNQEQITETPALENQQGEGNVNENNTSQKELEEEIRE
ncbi:MAG: protein secretion (post-translocation chaperonin) [Parcubacteria bacterium 32_520]|nr:MAG: protein secretion (post-translocation chaperonin) [Parcubacteria bacterium 32_520]